MSDDHLFALFLFFGFAAKAQDGLLIEFAFSAATHRLPRPLCAAPPGLLAKLFSSSCCSCGFETNTDATCPCDCHDFRVESDFA